MLVPNDSIDAPGKLMQKQIDPRPDGICYLCNIVFCVRALLLRAMHDLSQGLCW